MLAPAEGLWLTRPIDMAFNLAQNALSNRLIHLHVAIHKAVHNSEQIDLREQYAVQLWHM